MTNKETMKRHGMAHNSSCRPGKARAGWVLSIAASSSCSAYDDWGRLNAVSTVSSAISNPSNAGKILMGKAYTDNLWHGISRSTWERPQSWAGYNYTQFRNASGNVDRVDYFGGATWATRENYDGNDRGISIGNYINMRIDNEITGSFESRVLSDHLFMHEYGHTFQSRAWGPLYLPVIGAPSLFSAGFSGDVTTTYNGIQNTLSIHKFRWYERGANKHAEKYFRNKSSLPWDERMYPTIDRR